MQIAANITLKDFIQHLSSIVMPVGRRDSTPRGHHGSWVNFRERGHPLRSSRVYYAEDNTPQDNSELEEMFNQCTVKDVWTVITDTNSLTTVDWKV